MADLLADNFAGWLNGCMQKPKGSYRDAFELIEKDKQKIFNWYQLECQDGDFKWEHVLKNTSISDKRLKKMRKSSENY